MDDLAGLGLGEDSPIDDGPMAGGDGGELSAGDGSLSESPELHCYGCNISSKDDDPVEKRKKAATGSKGKAGAVKWGNSTKRWIKKKRGGERVRRIRKCGEWCLLCRNHVKRTVAKSPLYKKIATNKQKGKREACKQLKMDLRAADGKFRKRWKDEIDETVHLRAGGRSRVRGSDVNIVRTDEHSHEIIDNSLKFYTVKKYKELIGDPKITRAKIVTRTLKAGKKISGVYVREGEEGIYDVKDVYRTGAARQQKQHDGSEALHEAEAEEALSELEAELEDEDMNKGVLTLAESKKRVEESVPKDGEGEASEHSEARSGSEDGLDGESASGSNHGSGDDGSNSSGESDEDSVGRKKKKRKHRVPCEQKSEKSVSVATPSVKVSPSSRSKKLKVAASPPAAAVQDGSGSAVQGLEELDTKSAGRLGSVALQPLTAWLDKYSKGEFDSVKGGALRSLTKDVTEMLRAAKNVVAKSNAQQRSKVVKAITQVESVVNLVKLAAKPAPTYLELASSWDTVVSADALPTDGHTWRLVVLHAEHQIEFGNADKALAGIVGDGGSIRHTASKIQSESLRRAAATSILVRYTAAVLPPKVVVEDLEARRLLEPVLALLRTKPEMFTDEVAKHVQILTAITWMNKDSDRDNCCSALKACKDQAPDGRKAVESVLGAFVASRFGKTAIRAASALIETMTKDALVTDKFKDILVALSSVATTFGNEIGEQEFKNILDNVCSTVRDLENHAAAWPKDRPLPPSVESCVAQVQAWCVSFGAALVGLWHRAVEEFPTRSSGCLLEIRHPAKYTQAVEFMDSLAHFWTEFNVEVHAKVMRLDEPCSMIGKANFFSFCKVANAFKFVADNYSMLESTDEADQIRLGFRIGAALDDVACCNELLDSFKSEEGISVAKTLGKHLHTYMEEISSNMELTADGIEDALPVTLHKLVELFDNEGKMLDESATVSTLVALDLQVAGRQIDEAVGKMYILRFTSSGANDMDSTLGRLRALAVVMPPVKSSIACHMAAEAMHAAAGNWEVEWGFMQAVQALLSQARGLEGSGAESAEMLSRFNKFKGAIIQLCKDIGGSSLDELFHLVSNIEAHLVDLKPLLSNLESEDALSAYVNHAHHAALLPLLKQLQGEKSGGLKRYDRIAGTLRCMGITEEKGWNFVESRKTFQKALTKARAQIAIKGAVKILHRKSGNLVEGLLAESSRLKVTFPK